MKFNDIKAAEVSIDILRYAVPNADSYGNTNISGCLGIARYSSDVDDENFMFLQDLQIKGLISNYQMGIFLKKDTNNKIAAGSHITIGCNDSAYSYPAYKRNAYL